MLPFDNKLLVVVRLGVAHRLINYYPNFLYKTLLPYHEGCNLMP